MSVTDFVYTFVYREISCEMVISKSVISVVLLLRQLFDTGVGTGYGLQVEVLAIVASVCSVCLRC